MICEPCSELFRLNTSVGVQCRVAPACAMAVGVAVSLSVTDDVDYHNAFFDLLVNLRNKLYLGTECCGYLVQNIKADAVGTSFDVADVGFRHTGKVGKLLL